MRDWTGTRVREDALTVPCCYCHAIAGDPCVTALGTSLEAFPAHMKRMNDARKALKEETRE